MKVNKFTFFVALLGASLVLGLLGAPAKATFVDDATTRGLWHMDTINDEFGGGNVSDDNSTGRTARPMLLRPQPASATGQITTGAPGEGNAVAFDGVDDYGFAPGVWGPAVDTISYDFLMRPDGLPDAAGDNFMALVGTLPLQVYLQNDGNGAANVIALAFDQGGGGGPGFAFSVSQGGLALGQWHDVHVDVSNTGGANGVGELTMTVNGQTTTADMVAGLALNPSQAVIGRQVTANARFYEGALDEIRIGTEPIPEPASLALAGLAGLAMLMRRRK